MNNTSSTKQLLNKPNRPNTTGHQYNAVNFLYLNVIKPIIIGKSSLIRIIDFL